MLVRSLTLLVSALFCLCVGKSQQYGANRVIPPSPTAASLGAYGDVQVGYYTGTAGIQVPLYTLVQGDIKMSFALSASARGLQVAEAPGWVGSGMTLAGGGVITRSTAGLPDDLHIGFDVGYYYKRSYVSQINTGMLNGTTTWLQMDDVVNSMVDLQPDIYSYNFNGYSGRFYIDLSGNIYSFSYDNVLFEPTDYNNSTADHALSKFFEKWKATTPDGLQYFFEAREWTNSTAYIGTQQRYFWHVSSWYLTKVLSPQGHQVLISYTSPNTQKPRLQEAYFDKIGKWECGVNDPVFGTTVNAPSTTLTETIHMSSVQCTNATVLFQTSVRNDLYQQYTYGTPTCSIPSTCQEDRKLDKIIIKNVHGAVVNQFDFTYYENPSARLQLTSLKEAGKTPYTFEYNGNIPVTYSNKSIDHWGYYNGANNVNLIPVTQVVIPAMNINASYGTANRLPNITYGQLGSLKKITYPTGGSTEFEYQQNDYAYVKQNAVGGGNQPAGGIRIYKITNRDAVTSQTLIKEYEYIESGTTSSGVVGSEPLYQIHIYNIPTSCGQVFWLQSGSIFPLSYTAGSTIGYGRVKEKFSDGSENIYTFKTFYDHPDEVMALVYPLNPTSNNGTILELGPRTSKDHLRGRLVGTVMKDKYGNTVKEITSNYIVKTGNAHQETFFAFTPVNDPGSQNTGGQHPVFFPIMVGYRLKSEWVVKTQDIEKTHDAVNNVDIVIQTDYSYDNATHIQLTKKTQTNSKAETVEILYRYPGDALVSPSPTTAEQDAIDELIEARAYSTLLEQEQTVSSVSIERQRFTYKQFTPAVFPLLHKVSEESNGAGLVEKLRVDEYDAAGNLTERIAKDKILSKYIWDYSNSMPIAEVSGLTTGAKLAYTSFESDNTGGWTLSNVNYIAAVHGGITGRRAYNITGEVSKTGLDENTIYTVSFWVDGDKPEITKTNANNTTSNIDNLFQLKTTLGNWKLYKGTVSGAVGIKIVKHTNDALTYIDEVRLFPSGAVIGTYTYDPLVGITSQCDVNDHILNYSYDPYGRLLMLRDEDKNIVKRYCYNYNTQSDNCEFFGNAALSRPFQKQCSYGYTGTTVDYTVPANTYWAYTQTEADAMAWAESSANGLAFANFNGACEPVIIYAVLSTENITGSGTDYFGDVVVRFYSDENRTIPFSVQNLSVNVREDVHGGLCGCLASWTNYSINCNGDTVVLFPSTVLYQQINGSGEIDYMEHYFTLLVGTGYVGGQ
jgi:hypothetical protein